MGRRTEETHGRAGHPHLHLLSRIKKRDYSSLGVAAQCGNLGADRRLGLDLLHLSLLKLLALGDTLLEIVNGFELGTCQPSTFDFRVTTLTFLVRLRTFFWAASSSTASLAISSSGGGVGASAFLFLVRWRFFFSAGAVPPGMEAAPGMGAPGIYRPEGLPPLKIGVEAPELGAESSSRR
jgi:hypothetical protein